MNKQGNNGKGVTLRSIILSAFIIPFNAYFLINNHVYLSGLATTISLFYNVIIILTIVIFINFGVKLIIPEGGLNRGEILTIYVMLSIASAMAGHDMLQTVVPALTHAFWYATPENDWQQLFWRYLPNWLTMGISDEITPYYLGDSSLYTGRRLYHWLEPTLWWTLFFTALIVTLVCLSLFFQEQWIRYERLSYPIVHLPIELTDLGNSLFSSRLMWIGFSISAGLAILNGLHYLIPTFPMFPNRQYEIGALFLQKPWNAIGWTPIYVLPFAIGLAFFMPLDLSFSVWFFFWFWKGVRIFGSTAGFQGLPGFPYADEQTTGAYIAIAIFSAWSARHHLKQVFSLDKRKNNWAILGFVAGFSFLTFWMMRAGMSFGVILAYLLIYFTIALAITRIRAELGPPTHEMYQSTPHNLLVLSIGTRRLGPRNLTVMSLLWGFNRGYRAHPMPHTLEGFKLADIAQIHRGKLAFAIVLAAIIGTLSAYWAFIDMSYRNGAENNPGWGGFKDLQSWLYYPKPTNFVALIFMGIGVLITSVLRFMRINFLWWTLHPAGFALTGSTWTVGWLWFSVFISWLAKWILLKQGGIGAYRRAVPFFMGLLFGDYLIGGSWIIIRLIFNVNTYVFWR
ncbi:MAG: hypothetical protein NZ961_13690 [Candidatus Poribacteria bacterium]|nr:hypothetical protein [Candidatus Poribacteria bacterium]